ncbi:hypothetical protein GZH49_28605 [Nocardia terpenica]|uniref:AfsR/SARP family transcriptional regulator n=1 Tax=Nocardia terpenica TaxID=455432 RepID=UPI002FE32AD9
MKIKLLGRPAVVQDGVPMPPLSRRVGETLAILALSPDQRIDNHALAGLLFPNGRPSDSSCRSLVKKLRARVGVQALPNALGETRLLVAADDIDYLYFISLVERAKDEQGPDRKRWLHQALNLWSDVTALEGMELPYLDDKRRYIEACRANAVIALVEAEMEDHQFADALACAREAPNPCWDSDLFWKLYMSALAECGERGALTSVPKDYQRRVGSPMDDRLAKYHEYLLKNEVDSRKNRVDLDTPPWTQRQLPAGLSELTGRRLELSAVKDFISRRSGTIALCGAAGVGKTQLALLAARGCQDEFGDGVLFTNLHGFSSESPRDPRQQLLDWLPLFGVSLKKRGLDSSSVSTDMLAALYRSELAERSVLVVLDNARDVEQIRPLLPPPGSSVCVITSRNAMTHLTLSYDAKIMHLSPWATDVGIKFLAERLKDCRVAADIQSAETIVKYCAGLPLTLSLISSRLLIRPDLTLGSVTRELADIDKRLRSLGRTIGEPDIGTVLSWSINALQEKTIEAFSNIGVFPELAITAESFATVLLDSPAKTDEIIEELLIANILQLPDEDGLFGMHDMLRAYAQHCASGVDPTERRRVEQRALDFALHQAAACDNILDPGRGLSIPTAPREIPVKRPATVTGTLRLLDACYPMMRSAIRLADELKMNQYVVYLPVVLSVFYRKSARWADQVTALRQASIAAEQWAQPGEQALVQRMLGSAYNYVGHANLAIACQKNGIRISLENKDSVGEARGQQLLGVAYEKAGQLEFARPCYERSLHLFTELGDERGLAHAHNGMASVELSEGNLTAARMSAATALTVAHRAGDMNGESAAERNLARIEAALGDIEASAERYRNARARYLTDGYIAAAIVTCRAEIDILDNVSPERARTVRQEAIGLLAGLANPQPSDKQLLNELRADLQIDADQA